MNVKQRYREMQIRLYQKIADYIIQMMEAAPTTKDDYLFGMWLDMGIRFDFYCKEKEIYLD